MICRVCGERGDTPCGTCTSRMPGRAAELIRVLAVENQRLEQRLAEALARVEQVRREHEERCTEYAEEIAGIRAQIAELRRAREERERQATAEMVGALRRELDALPLGAPVPPERPRVPVAAPAPTRAPAREPAPAAPPPVDCVGVQTTGAHRGSPCQHCGRVDPAAPANDITRDRFSLLELD